MLKIKFHIQNRSSMVARMASRREDCDFWFTDAAGDPFHSLIQGLVAIKKSDQMRHSTSFHDETGLSQLRLSKSSDGQVTVTVSSEKEPPHFSYTADCDSVLKSFWNGLRTLEVDFRQWPSDDVWCGGRGEPFLKDLVTLKEML